MLQSQDSKRIEAKLDRIDKNTSKLLESQDGQLRRHSKDIDRLKQSSKRRTALGTLAITVGLGSFATMIAKWFAGQ